MVGFTPWGVLDRYWKLSDMQLQAAITTLSSGASPRPSTRVSEREFQCWLIFCNTIIDDQPGGNYLSSMSAKPKALLKHAKAKKRKEQVGNSWLLRGVR